MLRVASLVAWKDDSKVDWWVLQRVVLKVVSWEDSMVEKRVEHLVALMAVLKVYAMAAQMAVWMAASKAI